MSTTAGNKKLIAVVGATGQQGGAVVRALQADGQFGVRAGRLLRPGRDVITVLVLHRRPLGLFPSGRLSDTSACRFAQTNGSAMAAS
jgi:hypothetical protein